MRRSINDGDMDEQFVKLLTDTQATNDTTRKNAEWQIKHQYANPEFPVALVSISSQSSATIATRQAALLVLKNLVLACWSEQFEDFTGPLLADDQRKQQIRSGLLSLALSDQDDRKVKSAASLVVSKIATIDFPDNWPDLLPTVLNILSTGTDGQLHGALKVLVELVDDCFNQTQFFAIASDLVKAIYTIAADANRKSTLRALAVNVFRANFDILEMVMEDHKSAVKSFAEEVLRTWLPFFAEALKSPLPVSPVVEGSQESKDVVEHHRGLVAFKLQVVKCLMRIRTVFSSLLSPHSTVLFSATWEELSRLQTQYAVLYIDDDHQSRLEDADGLPYSLDFLVLEELDFLQSCLRAPPVRKELEQQLQSHNGSSTWIVDMMKLAVAFSQITVEEEGLWDIDVNVFLSEETNVTANYTPRTACGELVIKLGEWQSTGTVDGLLSYTRSLYTEQSSWKAKEAALYLLNQLLSDFSDTDRLISLEAASGFVEFVKHTLNQEEVFLRARGYIAAGSLVRGSGDAGRSIAPSFMESTLQAISADPSEVVKVSCIRALQFYMSALPKAEMRPMQPTIVSALLHFVNTQDLGDPSESDDLLITILEALREAIQLDNQACLNDGGMDLLFTLASKGASNFQIALLVTETFQEIATDLSSAGLDWYRELSAKVLPSLMGAFDVATLTEQNDLADLAAELLSVLADEGTTPLPEGFVGTCMPRLHRLLLGSHNEELLKSATAAVKHMLRHDAEQVFAWHDEAGKGGLEVVLTIIDRLLHPSVDDNSASEVGGLAAEIVEKAGSEQLGPYLTQLLKAVAARLALADQAQSVQSLILVFARLSLGAAHDVVAFLAESQVGEQNGLQVVMSKWLENSTMFAGYDEIRQNVIALTKIYELHDPRLASLPVKGDLVVRQSDRIMTRSRAKKQPDEFTSVPAQLKIVKVLVEELLSDSAVPIGGKKDDDSDDGTEGSDWEDEGDDVLDLSTGMTKSQLMALGMEDGPSRDKDDETQLILIEFFRQAGTRPEFAELFAALSQAEQDKLRSLVRTA